MLKLGGRFNSMNNEYQMLLDEVRQNYASVVWTHKIQEKQADIYHEKYAKLETVNILVASVTSCGIVSTIFCDNIWAKIIAAVLSFITLTITAYFKSFDIKGIKSSVSDNPNLKQSPISPKYRCSPLTQCIASFLIILRSNSKYFI